MHHAILGKDGTVAIMTLLDENADVTNEINKWSNKDDYIGHHPVDVETLPDGSFSLAWVSKDQVITIDLEKAKQIQLERIRIAREPKLAALDVEYIKAQETEDKVKLAEIIAAKNDLRNITEALKNLVPTSIEDIKNAFPAELKG